MSTKPKHGRPLNLAPDNRSLASRRQTENRANPTPAESHIIKLLDEIGEHYIFEKIFFTEKKFYIVDFYFPKPRKMVLELDGEIHNNSVAYDLARDNYLLSRRNLKRIIRIKNETALMLDVDGLRWAIS